MTEPTAGLIADIGGTNARFALVPADGGEPCHVLVLPCADFAGPAEAAQAYLARVAPNARPRRAAFAIAGPVMGDDIDVTNNPWRFSVQETARRIGCAQLEVVNDFLAVALCVPHLKPEHRVAIGGGAPAAGAPVGILGPGTGLGVSALVPCGASWHALPAEGGHTTLPAADQRESDVIGWLRGLYGHCSAERVISGPGLVNLYTTLCELEGRPAEALTPDVISARGLGGGDPLCREALHMFFAMLGTVAGNLALMIGARGGVYIAGGILPRMAEAFAASDFRARFEAKGRFAEYLRLIPTFLITHPYPAFLGLSGLVR